MVWHHLFLLDINHEKVDGEPEIRLWGLDDASRRILVVDKGFWPYFYLVLEDDADPEDIGRRVREDRDFIASVESVEAVNRRYFGKSVKTLRVVCIDPDETAKLASHMSKMKGVKMSLEEDIRYAQRYSIDKDVYPCGWHLFEGEEMKNETGASVDKVYVLTAPLKPIEEAETPSLKIMSFLIVCYSKKGSTKPDRNPVVIVSTANNRGETKQFVSKGTDDGVVLESFVKYVEELDPDIIVGYGSNGHEWPYLLERGKRAGIKLSVDRSRTEPHPSLYGHISITGRSNIDLYNYAEDFEEVKVKTLENMAKYLGVLKDEEEIEVEDVEVQGYWDDLSMRQTLLQRSVKKAETILGVSASLLDYAMQLSNIVGLPLDYVGAAAVGFRVEWYLIRQAYKIGEMVPSRKENPYFPYVDAIVLAPKPGTHENVSVLDFKSMYPNIMIVYNASPDTYIEPSEPDPPGGVFVAPEVKHRFRKDPPGFYKQVLSDLICIRSHLKIDVEKTKLGSAEYKLLDARQRAIKVITNASYGYTGWVGVRWYIRPVAEATAAWGRYTIKRAIELAKETGLDVIYGDTDSLFVKHDPKKTETFLRKVERELSLVIRPDVVYERVFFTEAKKRYAGLLPDGRLDIVGMEVARGDWAEVAKHVQEKVLDIILKKQSPEKAVDFVRQYIIELRNGKVTYSDLIVWKTLTKPVEEYEVNAPHVEAAKMLRKDGWNLTIGDKVGFVIIKGKGRLYERVLPYSLAKYGQLDLEYYEEQQILPAAIRVLSLFGKKEDDLKPLSSTVSSNEVKLGSEKQVRLL